MHLGTNEYPEHTLSGKTGTNEYPGKTYVGEDCLYGQAMKFKLLALPKTLWDCSGLSLLNYDYLHTCSISLTDNIIPMGFHSTFIRFVKLHNLSSWLWCYLDDNSCYWKSCFQERRLSQILG